MALQDLNKIAKLELECKLGYSMNNISYMTRSHDIGYATRSLDQVIYGL